MGLWRAFLDPETGAQQVQGCDSRKVKIIFAKEKKKVFTFACFCLDSRKSTDWSLNLTYHIYSKPNICSALYCLVAVPARTVVTSVFLCHFICALQPSCMDMRLQNQLFRLSESEEKCPRSGIGTHSRNTASSLESAQYLNSTGHRHTGKGKKIYRQIALLE